MLRLRKKDSEDKRFWNPERDLAVVYPSALRETFHELAAAFDPDNPTTGLVAGEVADALGVREADVGDLARLYAQLIGAVRSRNLPAVNDELLRAVAFRQPQVHAVVGLVFLKVLTEKFVCTYGENLIVGEADPNDPALADLVLALDRYRKEIPLWKRIWNRLVAATAILFSPLGGTGRC